MERVNYFHSIVLRIRKERSSTPLWYKKLLFEFFRLRTSLFKPKTFLEEPEEEWVELCTGAETIEFTGEEGRGDKPELTS